MVFTGSLSLVYCRFRQRSSSKKSNLAICEVCVCVYHLNRCKTSDWFSLVCRGVQSTVETAPNEAIHLCWKQSLINSVYLQNLVSTVDQAVTLRCFESTRLPQSVLHASEPSSDFRRNHIADSIMIFLTYFRRDHVADELWVILGNNRRNIIVDSQHAG